MDSQLVPSLNVWKLAMQPDSSNQIPTQLLSFFSWHQPASTLCLWNPKFCLQLFWMCHAASELCVSIHAVSSIWHDILTHSSHLTSFKTQFTLPLLGSIPWCSLPSFLYLKHTSIISLILLDYNGLFIQLPSLLDCELICDIGHILFWYPSM